MENPGVYVRWFCDCNGYWNLYSPSLLVNQIYSNVYKRTIIFAADEINGINNKINRHDPNDSEKFVEFDEAINEMFDRYLWFMDDVTSEALEGFIRNFPDSLKLSIQVDAAELVDLELFKPTAIIEPGTDKEHPLELSGYVGNGSYDYRYDIYRYYWGKLKLIGDNNNLQGVWINKTYFASHCHNVFLQFAYDFGIIVGVIFILFVLISYITALFGLIKRRTGQNYFRLFVCVGYTTLFVTFGMLEQDWLYGQLAFTMFWLVQYVIVHKELEKISVGRKIAPIQVELPVEEDGLEILDLDSVVEGHDTEVDWQMD